MDPYNVELRAYQDDIGSSLNHNHMVLEHMMSHLHIPRNDSFPKYLHIQSWEDRRALGKVEPVVVVADMEDEMTRTRSDYPFLLFLFDMLRQFYFVCVFSYFGLFCLKLLVN